MAITIDSFYSAVESARERYRKDELPWMLHAMGDVTAILSLFADGLTHQEKQALALASSNFHSDAAYAEKILYEREENTNKQIPQSPDGA